MSVREITVYAHGYVPEIRPNVILPRVLEWPKAIELQNQPLKRDMHGGIQEQKRWRKPVAPALEILK